MLQIFSFEVDLTFSVTLLAFLHTSQYWID